ncbi:hypothetical protein NGB36_04485 [Streptomyces sp. RB6PN25]|uniref:Integral membrane protein n=1 Tax=Streptomyces humicola TaxID=2953240 RepID=A0ABT1PRV9_9ACTN|nr:hypothetical protein [Streptomyces humicola]MCQ4079868.1 hypothetical protein [Streptomyces humicola]
MPGSARATAVLTVVALVAACAYSVTLGGNGWLWSGWVLLLLLTAGSLATRDD